MGGMACVYRMGSVLVAIMVGLTSCAFQGDAAPPFLDVDWQTASSDAVGPDAAPVPAYVALTECVTSTVHSGPYMQVWLSGEPPEEGQTTVYSDGATMVLERFADRRCKTKLMTSVMRRNGSTTSPVPGEAWNWQLVFWTGEIVEIDAAASCVSCHTYCPNDGVCGDYSSKD
jgi:hypothetical protein